ncbi:MAG: FapA family protein [Syntrophobacteraceae bacterium]
MAEPPRSQPGPDDDKTLCRLAVRHRMLTEDQVRSALTIKERERRRGRDIDMEEILKTKGWISVRQLNVLRQARDLMKLRAGERTFAQTVVRQGSVTQEQVEEALSEQTRRYKESCGFITLEAILRELGYLKDGQSAQMPAVPVLEDRCPTPEPAVQEGLSVQGPADGEGGGESLASVHESGSEGASDSPSDRMGKVILRERSFDLIVSHDEMEAYLRLKGGTAPDLTVERLIGLLEAKGITFGVVDDHLLRRGLKQRSDKSIVFKVAQGAPPKTGRNAGVHYFLAANDGVSEEASIKESASLKDRGVIPQVKEGDLLAEKSPRIPGIEGMNVFGTVLAVPETKDEPLLCGSGVALSEDGLRATAKVDGRAMFSAYGKLTVLEEHTISSDVSFETGNIDFNGIVFVHGVVQDGFRVRCGSLVCNEIGRAEIDVGGDVTVFGGILGAQVRCQGDLKCVHIHASKIEALGDVQADKGIVDSKVKTSGKCVLKSGTVAASLVYAKKGIEAVHIGHERSRPCTLAIGFDPLMERELERLKEVVVAKEAEGAQQRGAIEEMRAQLLRAEQRTGEIAQMQDLTLRERRTTVGMLEDARRQQDSSMVKELEEAVAELDAKARETEQELEELLDVQDQLKAMIRTHKETVRGFEREIERAKEEMAVITSWGQSGGANAAVRVRGKIFGGTSIRGCAAMATLKDTLSGVAIREITVNAESGETAMRVTRLR